MNWFETLGFWPIMSQKSLQETGMCDSSIDSWEVLASVGWWIWVIEPMQLILSEVQGHPLYVPWQHVLGFAWSRSCALWNVEFHEFRQWLCLKSECPTTGGSSYSGVEVKDYDIQSHWGAGKVLRKRNGLIILHFGSSWANLVPDAEEYSWVAWFRVN